MKILENLKYSNDHEWVRVEGNRAYIGITDFAQHALGDIVFVELPQIDAALNKGDVLGVVESVKAASDIYSPVSGTVVQTNEELADSPEKVNSDPYESWIAVVELSDLQQLDELLDAEGYRKLSDEGE